MTQKVIWWFTFLLDHGVPVLAKWQEDEDDDDEDYDYEDSDEMPFFMGGFPGFGGSRGPEVVFMNGVPYFVQPGRNPGEKHGLISLRGGLPILHVSVEVEGGSFMCRRIWCPCVELPRALSSNAQLV